MILQLRHAIIALALLALILWWPTYHASGLLPGEPSYVLVSIGIAGLLLTICVLCLLTRRWVTLLWLWPLLAVLVLTRLTHLGLIQFSGMGYGLEFFIHLEWQSLVLAWQEHGRLVRRGIILLALLFIPAALLAFRSPRLSPGLAGLVMLAGVAGLVIGRQGMPEWKLIQAWQQWRSPVVVAVDEAYLRHWRESGIVETDLPTKQWLDAVSPESSKNLIILYLESIGVALADHPDWPELLPTFKQLLKEHAFVDHVHASSYITIEGITNSQCGTLFPFTRDSDSLASGDGLANRMACMGDVLSAAGYHQVYMGGAQNSFAGKGAFLEAHGYDEVYGLEEWSELGLKERPGTWGLSDVDLFEQSLIKLKELERMDRPWNLTLLTIGTHLPGYFYQECMRYQGSDEVFVNALHCTDQLLADWIEHLERDGYLDDAILVVTADHHVFPSPDMRELFGDSVFDRRLPFIVIGRELPSAAVQEGGGYDLAPTVLDLLGIRHNARFALGRSLLAESSARDYYFRRDDDVFAGERVANHRNDCAGETPLQGPPRLPLDSCGKRSLLGVLGALAEAHSIPRTALSCNDGADALVAHVPAAPSKPFEFLIAGLPQSNRFNRNGYPVESNKPGLYLASFSASGELVSLQYRRPSDELEDWLSAQVTSLKSRAAVLVWRPPGGNDSAGREMPVIGELPAGAPGIWVLDAVESVVLDQRLGSDSMDGVTYRLSPETCTELFESHP